jgi:hypothetical protein
MTGRHTASSTVAAARLEPSFRSADLERILGMVFVREVGDDWGSRIEDWQTVRRTLFLLVELPFGVCLPPCQRPC